MNHKLDKDAFLLAIYDNDTVDENKLFNRIEEVCNSLSKVNSWDLKVALPDSILKFEYEDIEIRKRWFSKKTKEVKVKQYAYILLFDFELSAEQLNCWRMFKAGFITGVYPQAFSKYYEQRKS